MAGAAVYGVLEHRLCAECSSAINAIFTTCQVGIIFTPFADKENRIQKKGNLLSRVT